MPTKAQSDHLLLLRLRGVAPRLPYSRALPHLQDFSGLSPSQLSKRAKPASLGDIAKAKIQLNHRKTTDDGHFGLGRSGYEVAAKTGVLWWLFSEEWDIQDLQPYAPFQWFSYSLLPSPLEFSQGPLGAGVNNKLPNKIADQRQDWDVVLAN